MNMRRFWILAAWSAVAIMNILPAITCHDISLNAAEPPVNRKITLSPHQREMSDNNTDFACNLFRAINKDTQGNVSTIVSPISVSYMLGMLNEGAEGKTFQQISDVLGLGGSVDEINNYFKKMIDEAPRVDSRVTMKIANSINVNSALGISLIPQYEADMLKYYHAQIDALDFNKSSNVDIINYWCNIHTNGMIPKILYNLEAGAAMYLLNAVYFKAAWTNKFDPTETHDMDFTMPNGCTVKLPLMHLNLQQAKYDENNLCKALCLPYGSMGYSMYILLPNEGKTVNDIIQSLSSQSIKKLDYGMKHRHVDILIPRFTASNETDLKNVLSSMGMPLAFDENHAEFTNMAQSCILYVSMMKQKAIIEVNEEGTKAAAVTVTKMTNRSMVHAGSCYAFHATRPFVYYIVENSTGSLFFMGTYCGN